MFAKYRDSPALGPELFARMYGVDASLVKSIPVDSLNMIKVSYARPNPQGWLGRAGTCTRVSSSLGCSMWKLTESLS